MNRIETREEMDQNDYEGDFWDDDYWKDDDELDNREAFYHTPREYPEPEN